MRQNAKDNLSEALEELCCCQNHLNIAYLHAEGTHNKREIHIALKAISSAVDSAKQSLLHFQD